MSNGRARQLPVDWLSIVESIFANDPEFELDDRLYSLAISELNDSYITIVATNYYDNVEATASFALECFPETQDEIIDFVVCDVLDSLSDSLAMGGMAIIVT